MLCLGWQRITTPNSFLNEKLSCKVQILKKQIRNQVDLKGKGDNIHLLISNYPELMIEWDGEAEGIWKKEGCRCFRMPGAASRNGSDSVPLRIHANMPSYMPISINTHTHYPNMKTSLRFNFIQPSEHIRQCFLCLNLSTWTLIAWGRGNHEKHYYFSLDDTRNA